jgi:hypothetical protein
MTEAEWLACVNPWKALDAVVGKASARKLQLLCCAVERRRWP